MGALLRPVREMGKLLCLLPLLLCGCTGEDNEHLGRVGRKIVDRAETLLGDPDGRLHRGWQTLRGEMGEVGLQGKVSQRLAWDKNLADARIQVRADGGAVELKGASSTTAAHGLRDARSTATAVPSDSPWITTCFGA